nr:dehydrogenase/reductase SDR family member 2, mitochondrial-like [Vicugna pacos]
MGRHAPSSGPSPCSLFRACAGLSAPLSSSGIDQNDTLANRVGLGGEENGGEELRLSPSFHFYCKIGLAFAWHLVQGGAHVVVSSQKQESMDWTVAVLQGDGQSVTGIITVCHVGKAEDQERLVAMVKALESCGGISFLVGSAAVSPQEGSSLGTSEQVGDKRTVGTLSFLCPPVAIYSTGENMVVAG